MSYPVIDPLSPSSKLHGSCALTVMAKAPRAGEVKTRLVPPLTFDEAAALSRCLLRDTTAHIAEVASSNGASGVAAYAPVGSESVFGGLLPEGFSLLPQRGTTLGNRLFHATEDLLAFGYTSVCLINADSPTLPRALLGEAVARLARPGERIVLGPADDGGYYLIGLKSAHRGLFSDVEWSTHKVLSQTIERAVELDLPVELLPSWYDIDDSESLARLCDELLCGDGGTEGSVDADASSTRDFLIQLIKLKGREYIRLGKR